MNIDYLFSIFDLYLHNEKKDKKINFSMIKKDDMIEFNFAMQDSLDDKTNFTLPLDIVNSNLEKIINTYKDNLMIIDEKYSYSPNNTAYYYVIFQNGRTFSCDGFSVLELNNIRNILYNISIHKEEIRVDDINNKKQMVYKPKMRLQQTGFTSVVTLLLGVLFFADILVIALWIFKLITK